MMTSEQVNEIAAALAKAQGEMRPAVKDATNPHYRSRYADLAANVEAAREPLAKNGLAVVQEAATALTVETEHGEPLPRVPGILGVSVSTRILHSSGQWIQFAPLTVPLSKVDAHGVGSATTYARRYALGAALGLVAEDDDASAAVTVVANDAALLPTRQPAPQAARKAVPLGFQEWWFDIKAVADNGKEALEKAWMQSKPEYRKHLAENHAEAWQQVKAKAAAVKVSA